MAIVDRKHQVIIDAQEYGEGQEHQQRNPMICTCHKPPFYFADYVRTELGEDSSGGEVVLLRCKKCASLWLEYLIDEPHYSRSGRWWRVAVASEYAASMSAENAKEFIEQQASGFVGGSFFDSSGHRIAAPIRVA